jgi:hypothetical protein
MLHDYAIFNHSRTAIGRYLGILSFTFASTITSLLAIFSKLTGNTLLAGASITSALVYIGLHWLFNNHFWTFKRLNIPVINGIWTVRGETLNEDGTVKYNWKGEVDIEQNWEKISIALQTEKSSSESYTATLSRKSGNKKESILHYSYTNNPNIDEFEELNSHKGYCEMIFNKNATSAEAAYFNSNGRRTFGKMYLTKNEDI